MCHLKVIVTLIVALFFFLFVSASDEGPGGVWGKTTHPDSNNVSIFYVEPQAVKAIGYGRIAGKPAIWYAEGVFREGRLTLKYRYSPDATPDGWEAEGTMRLSIPGNRNDEWCRYRGENGQVREMSGPVFSLPGGAPGVGPDRSG